MLPTNCIVAFASLTSLVAIVGLMKVRLAGPPDPWIAPFREADSGIVEILGAKSTRILPSGKAAVAHLVQLTGDHLELMVETNVLHSPGVVSLQVADLARGRRVAIVVSVDCSLCDVLVGPNSQCFLASAVVDHSGKMIYEILSDHAGLEYVRQEARKLNVPLEVVGTWPLKVALSMTPRQQRIIDLAVEMGFYDFPRRITQEKLSRLLGISPSGLNEILRRAEKKIIAQYGHSQLNGPSANGSAELALYGNAARTVEESPR